MTDHVVKNGVSFVIDSMHICTGFDKAPGHIERVILRGEVLAK
jgi:hypothetical protein